MKRNRARVMMLIDHLGTGGAQILLRDALERHDKRRFEFIVAYLCEWRAPQYRSEYERLGATVIPVSRWKSLVAVALDLSMPIRIARLVKRLRIDLLEVHLFASILPATLAHILTPNCPMIYVLHARRHQLPAPVYPILRLVSPRFRLFAIGDGHQSELKAIGIPEEKQWYTRSAASFGDVDEWGDRPSSLEHEFEIPIGSPVALNVSRLHESKGQDFLLEGFVEVLQRVPDAWLVIVGDGPEEARLKRLSTGLGIAHRVVFAGFRSDLPSFYRGARVYAVPGLGEAMGLATLSAMASGLPVVAFDVGNLHRVVSTGQTGALVAPHDRHRFIDELVHLLSCPTDEWKRLGHAARERVRALYSVDAFIADREAAYAHLLRGTRSGQSPNE